MGRTKKVIEPIKEEIPIVQEEVKEEDTSNEKIEEFLLYVKEAEKRWADWIKNPIKGEWIKTNK